MIAHPPRSAKSYAQRVRAWLSTPCILASAQRNMLHRLKGDFEGKLTAAKWAKLEKVSADTALRDINDLVSKGILVRSSAGGRSTSYVVVSLK